MYGVCGCMEWKRRGHDLGEYLLRKGHDAFTIDSESAQ